MTFSVVVDVLLDDMFKKGKISEPKNAQKTTVINHNASVSTVLVNNECKITSKVIPINAIVI